MATLGVRLRSRGFPAAAVALLTLEVVTRIAVGTTYLGATFLLVAACGLVLVPFLPSALATTSLRLALIPILGLGVFTILLTTVSLVGVALTELSIRLSVALLVVTLGLAGLAFSRQARVASSHSREGIAIATLACIVALSFAASWDVIEPFPPPGTDWALHLLYADEVRSQQHLLIDNPYVVGEARSLGNYPGIGALYGSLRILDGVSSRSLVRGLAVAMALSPLALYAAVAAFWGIGAGLFAAATYAVASIHLEPLYWHGLATTLALVFVPVTLLALGLVYRGCRDPATVVLLGLSLAALAAVHVVSAGVIALTLGVLLLADVALGLLERRGTSLRTWWRVGTSLPILVGVGVGALLGIGVLVHLKLVADDVGRPVSYTSFDRSWLDLDTIDYYFSWRFILLAAASLLVAVFARELRGDAALLPVGALALAAVLVSQAWRVHVSFEYRRVVYYLAIPLVIAIGIAAARLLSRGRLAILPYVVLLLAIAQGSIGLRLPERLLESAERRSDTIDALDRFRRELLDRQLVVADRCLGPVVPYVLQTPTYVAADDWQVGFEKKLPAARTAIRLLAGGDQSHRIADQLGVRYAVLDPTCTPGAAARLRGRAIVTTPDLVIVDLL